MKVDLLQQALLVISQKYPPLSLKLAWALLAYLNDYSEKKISQVQYAASVALLLQLEMAMIGGFFIFFHSLSLTSISISLSLSLSLFFFFPLPLSHSIFLSVFILIFIFFIYSDDAPHNNRYGIFNRRYSFIPHFSLMLSCCWTSTARIGI